MRLRITVRGEGIELRGIIDRDNLNQVHRLFADDIEDEAIIVASHAEDDYDPFKEAELRELHRSEVEEDNDNLHRILERQSTILTATVNALRGNPPELTTWSHHDIADWAAKVVRQRDGYKHERENLLRQLADPPPGWFPLGHHVDQPDVKLEFWGDDGGAPILERPVQ